VDKSKSSCDLESKLDVPAVNMLEWHCFVAGLQVALPACACAKPLANRLQFPKRRSRDIINVLIWRLLCRLLR
jgi:hypothetical protein